MKVVLLERVENLGAIGDVVSVKDGFARNFLLPRDKARRATSANLKAFELDRAAIEARNEKNKAESQKVADKIDGQTYVMIRQAGETGQLYGSVAGRDVAEAIQAEGGKVERSQVVLNTAIKTLGVHEVSSATASCTTSPGWAGATSCRSTRGRCRTPVGRRAMPPTSSSRWTTPGRSPT